MGSLLIGCIDALTLVNLLADLVCSLQNQTDHFPFHMARQDWFILCVLVSPSRGFSLQFIYKNGDFSHLILCQQADGAKTNATYVQH